WVRGEDSKASHDLSDWIGHGALRLSVAALTGRPWASSEPQAARDSAPHRPLDQGGHWGRGLEGATRASYIWSHVWTCSALNRLLGNQDQAEVRRGLSGAEHSGLVERVPDRSD